MQSIVRMRENEFIMLPYERYMGIESTYKRLGFVEVACRSQRRPILRYFIQP